MTSTTPTTIDAAIPFGFKRQFLRNEIRQFADSIVRLLRRPVIPSDSHLSVQLALALPGLRRSLQSAFQRAYPEVSLEASWERIRREEYPISELSGLPDGCLADFVNVTAWCFAREGTGETGRFSVDRLWRVLERDAATINGWIKPYVFETTCGACDAQAIATAHSASLASIKRPTRIECRQCGHVDQVGRPVESSARDQASVTPRLQCVCAKCDSLRKRAVDEARDGIDAAIAAHVHAIASHLDCHTVARELRPRESEGYESAVWCCEAALAQGMSLKDALSASPVRTGGSAGARLAETVEHGIRRGWLELIDVEPIDTPGGPIEAIEKGIDLAINDAGSALERLRTDMRSGDLSTVLSACADIWKFSYALAPVVTHVRWVGSEAAPSTADTTLTPAAVVPTSEGEVRQECDLSHAAELLRAAAELVDQVLGIGVSRRCPELVLEMIRIRAGG